MLTILGYSFLFASNIIRYINLYIDLMMIIHKYAHLENFWHWILFIIFVGWKLNLLHEFSIILNFSIDRCYKNCFWREGLFAINLSNQMATLVDTVISGFRKHIFIHPVEKLPAKIAYPAKEACPRGYRKINPKVLLRKTGFFKRKLISEAALFLLSMTLNK